jgi:DNA-binding HxlR family transcriptional regulator
MATARQRRSLKGVAGQQDPVERSLAVVGLKWTLLIVRDLIEGPRRFMEIQRSLQRANPKMITARLRELELAGVVSRTAYAEVPPRVEYALTERGRALRPVIDALRDWGRAKWARRPP